VILVGGQTRMAQGAGDREDVFGKEPQGVNPDEVVAIGAAFRAAAGRRVKDVLLLDVTPLSLGMRPWACDHRAHSANTTCPTKVGVFSTAEDNQTRWEITSPGRAADVRG